MVSQPKPPPPGAFGIGYSLIWFVVQNDCLPLAPSTKNEKPFILHFLTESGCHCFKIILGFFLLTLYFLL